MTGGSDMNIPVPPYSSQTYTQLQNHPRLPAPTSPYAPSLQYFGAGPPIALEVPQAPGLHYGQKEVLEGQPGQEGQVHLISHQWDYNRNVLPYSNLVLHSPHTSPRTSISDAEKNMELVESSPRSPLSDEEKKPRKGRSPAKKAKQMRRLLAFQDKLVLEKGLPKSRLQNELGLMSITLARELGIKPIPPTSAQDSGKMSYSTAPSRTPIPPAPEHGIGLSLIPSTQEQDLGRMVLSAASTMPRQNRVFSPVSNSIGHVGGVFSGFCWGCRNIAILRPVRAAGKVFCLSCGRYGYINFMEVIVLNQICV